MMSEVCYSLSLYTHLLRKATERKMRIHFLLEILFSLAEKTNITGKTLLLGIGDFIDYTLV